MSRRLLHFTFLLILFSFYCYSAQLDQSDSFDEKRKAAIMHYQRGLRYANEGQLYDLAIKEYKKAIQLDPSLSQVHLELAASYFAQRLFDETVEQCLQALKGNLPPASRGSAYINLSASYVAQGKFEKAEAAIKEAINLSPNSASAHYRLGDIRLKRGQIESAIVEYNRTIELDPNLAEPYEGLGLAYITLSESEKAIKFYLEAINRDRYDSASYYNIARGYQRLNKSKESQEYMAKFKRLKEYQHLVEQYKMAFDKQPDNPALRLKLAGLHYEIGNLEEALKECQVAIYIDNNFAPAYNNLGFIYLDQNDLEKALSAFKKTLELSPEASTAYFGLGQVYARQKKWNLAKSQFQKAIQLDSKHESAYEALAEIHIQNEDPNAALETYRQLIKAKPQVPSGWQRLGVLYMRLKRFDEAINCFKQTIQLDSSYVDGYNNLAWLYAELEKNLDEALQFAKKAVALDPSAPYIDTIGWIYYKIGNYQQAEKELLRAVELEPQNEEYQRHLKQIRQKTEWESGGNK